VTRPASMAAPIVLAKAAQRASRGRSRRERCQETGGRAGRLESYLCSNPHDCCLRFQPGDGYTDAVGQANVDATDYAAVLARHETRSRWTSMAPQVID